MAVRAFKGAVIKGAITKMTGGKFANGAISGAIQAAMMGLPSTRVSGSGSNLGGRSVITSEVEGTLSVSSLNDENGYDLIDDAAIAQYNAYSSEYGAASAKGNEVLGIIINRGGRLFFSDVMEVPIRFKAEIGLDGIRPSEVSGYTHTHPDRTSFSGIDYETPSSSGKPYYVRTSAGNVYRWDASGAAKYARYVRGLQRSGSIQSLSREIDNPRKWGIHNVCPGGNPCVR